MAQVLENLMQDIKTAMKAGEKHKVTILRTLHADIKKVAIDTRKELSLADEQNIKTTLNTIMRYNYLESFDTVFNILSCSQPHLSYS